MTIHFDQEIFKPLDVLSGPGHTTFGLDPFGPVPGDTGYRLDQLAALLRSHVHKSAYLILIQNGVSPDPGPGVHKEVVNIFQPAGLAVNPVFSVSGPVDTPYDLDFR